MNPINRPIKETLRSLYETAWYYGVETFPVIYMLFLKATIALMIAVSLIAAGIVTHEVYASIENGTLTTDIKSLLHNILDGKLDRITASSAALLASLMFSEHLIRDKHFGFVSFCIL
tara:strand:- start:8149 stop:8499 length:351 start_codon:yes stop_codon:yes gene_type:complete